MELHEKPLTGVTVWFDIDGVGYDFVGVLRQYGRDLGLNIPDGEPQCWDFFESQWHMTLEQFMILLELCTNSGIMFRVGGTMPGYVAGIRRLKAAGAQIYFITNRFVGAPGVAAAGTIWWLDRVDLRQGRDYDGIAFAADKVPPCAGATIVIDDSPHNWRDLTDAGIRCVLLDAPYNRDCAGAERVATIEEFTALVLLDYGK